MFASLHIGVISLRFPFRMRLPFSACIALLTSVLLLAWAAVAPGAAGQVEFTEAEDSSVLTGVRLGSSSIADVNGDGNKDLLITGSGTATLYLGDGQGGFAKADASSVLAGVAGSSSSVADVNGDGHKDLLIIGADANFDPAATLYLGDGQGGFAKADASSNLTGVNEGSSSIADVDGDGNKDLLITGEDPDTSRTATLYRGDGTGGFAEADASSNLTGVMNSSSSIADVDGDGNKDLLITGFADNGRTATLYFGDGQGGFAKADASSTLTGVYESSSSIADVDGDGNKDLLITGGDPNPNPTATLYFGDGQGGFTEADASSILTGVYGGSSSIADVDGDGDKDLLITGSGTATLYLGDGQGGFAKADARLVQTGVYESSSSIADVDGDGNKDLLITGRDANYNPMAKLYLQQAGVRDTVLRVDQSVSSPGPGTSWNNAYQSLQNALAAADTTGATEIWVAEGAYHPDEGSSVRDGRRDTSFVLQNGVAIYGGFSGNEQSRSGRDVESNRTIFSGEIQRDGDQSNNSYHVVNASTVDSTAVLDGVTVEGGRANGSGLAANGGGLLADRGGPTIRNVTFRNNFASNGGGVALVNSGPNSASKTARLSGTRFIQNRAETRGGGLYVGGTDAEMARAEIRGNEALLGGGLATGSHSTVRAVSSLLSGNVAEASGGAVQTDQIENTSSTDTLDLVNTTIAGNRSPRGGGLRLEGRFDVRLTNSIVWNNSRGGGGQIIADNAALRIERSAIQGRDNISQLGLRGGAGAIADQADDASVYPRFVRPVLPGRAPTTEGDFHLQKPTLLEDAGTGSVLSGSSKDLDGESRVAGEDVDIGAYEGAVSTTAPDFTFSEKRVPRSFVDGSNLERQSISKDVALRFRYTDAPSSAPSQLFVYRASQGSPMFEKIAEIPAPEDLASTSEYVDTSAEPEKQYRYAVAAPGAATPVFSRQMSSAVQAFNTPLVGGTVVRNSDESPLSGAQISVKDVTGVRAVTDRKGRYLLDGLNAGLRGYQIVATSGLDSSTRTLEKGLNERQQRVRIVDFTLAATSVSEVELQPVLSSRDREPIDVPYYGEAFYYVRVQDSESGEALSDAQVETDILDENENVVCEGEATSDFDGVAQIRIRHSPCIQNGGSEVNVDKVKVNGSEYDVDVSFDIGDIVKNKYEKTWAIEGKSSFGGSIALFGAGPGRIRSGVWKASIENGPNTDRNVAGAEGEVKSVTHIGKRGEAQSIALSSALQFQLKVGEVIEGDISAGASSNEGAKRFVKHQFDLMETYTPTQTDVILTFLGDDIKDGFMPWRLQHVTEVARENALETGVNYIDSNFESTGLEAQTSFKNRLSLQMSTFEVDGYTEGMGIDLLSERNVRGVNKLKVEHNPRQSKSTTVEITSRGLFDEGQTGEFNWSLLVESIGVDDATNIREKTVAVNSFSNAGDAQIGSIDEKVSIIQSPDSDVSGSPILKDFTDRSGGFGEYLDSRFNKQKLTISHRVTSDRVIDRVSQDREVIESSRDVAQSLIDQSGSVEPLEEFDGYGVLNDNLLNIDEADLHPDGVPYTVTRTLVEGADFRLSLAGVLGVGASVSYGPQTSSKIKNVREKGVFKDRRYYPFQKFREPPQFSRPNLVDIIREFTTEQWRENALSSWEGFTQSVNQSINVGKELALEFQDEASSQVNALVETGEEAWNGFEGEVQRCTADESVESSVRCFGESVSEVGARYIPAEDYISSVTSTSKAASTSASRTLPRSDTSSVLRFDPYGVVSPDPGTNVKLRIPGEYLTNSGLNVADLTIYRKNVVGTEWTPLPTSVNSDSTFLTAVADTLTAFTIRKGALPPRLDLSAEANSIPADGRSTVEYSATPQSPLDGSQVPDTTEFTVTTALGEITTLDANESRSGVQVAPESGELTFEVRSGQISGSSKIAVTGPFGKVLARDTLQLTNTGRPSSPVIRSVKRTAETAEVGWSQVGAEDLAGYRIYFDSDQAGGPYDGTATVGGNPSPVNVGSENSGLLEGLDPDSTYYLSATAYDVQGSESGFASAVRIPPAGSPGAPVAFAFQRIQADTSLKARPTGFGARFTAADSGRVAVKRFPDAPDGTLGISEQNVSEYRWIVETGPDLSFDSTQVRLPVGSLSGIEGPSGVTIYRRPEAGTGAFEALNTRVGGNSTPGDISDDTLYATAESLGEFALASDSNPLPVELAQVEATSSKDGVQLTWKTISETNNAGFEVQRRSFKADETATWEEVGFVDGAGTTSESQRYQFADERIPYTADSLKYRLIQIDTDGRRTRTDPVTVERSQVRELELLGTYPNPADTRATVRFAVPKSVAVDEDVKVELYDVLGRRVRMIRASAKSGRHKTQINVSELASGLYFLRVRASDDTRTQKITIVH